MLCHVSVGQVVGRLGTPLLEHPLILSRKAIFPSRVPSVLWGEGVTDYLIPMMLVLLIVKLVSVASPGNRPLGAGSGECWIGFSLLSTSPDFGLSSSTEGCCRGRDSPSSLFTNQQRTRESLPPPLEVLEGLTTPQHTHLLPSLLVEDVKLGKTSASEYQDYRFTQDIRLFPCLFSLLQSFQSSRFRKGES